MCGILAQDTHPFGGRQNDLPIQVHLLTVGTCGHAALHSKTDFAEGIKVMGLDYPIRPKIMTRALANSDTHGSRARTGASRS